MHDIIGKYHTIDFRNNTLDIDLLCKEVKDYNLLLEKVSTLIKDNIELNTIYQHHKMVRFSAKIDLIVEEHITNTKLSFIDIIKNCFNQRSRTLSVNRLSSYFEFYRPK